MPVQQLRLYDTVVDLIPGLLFLILFLGALPINPGDLTAIAQLGLGSGLIVLLVAFAFGRIIHTVAAHSYIEKLRYKWNWIGKWREWKNYPESELEFEERIAKSFDSIELSDDKEEPLERRVRRKLVSRAEESFEVDSIANAVQTQDEPNGCFEELEEDWESDLKYLKHLCQSVLADRSSLYQTYVILVTFYRSLWLITIFGALVYSLIFLFGHLGFWNSLWYQSIPKNSVAYWATGVTIPIILLVISFLANNRRLEFKHRRVRALINDTFLHLGS